jgi:CHRD domain
MQPFPSPVSPIDGSATLSETQEKSLVNGTVHVNFHTQAHPGGELRGQLVRQ